MTCPPGAGLWTRDSTYYKDDGSGEVWVEDKHYDEADAAGWELAPSYDVVPGEVEDDHTFEKASDDDDTTYPTLAELSELERVCPPEIVQVLAVKKADKLPMDVHTISELTTEESTTPKRTARR